MRWKFEPTSMESSHGNKVQQEAIYHAWYLKEEASNKQNSGCLETGKWWFCFFVLAGWHTHSLGNTVLDHICHQRPGVLIARQQGHHVFQQHKAPGKEAYKTGLPRKGMSKTQLPQPQNEFQTNKPAIRIHRIPNFEYHLDQSTSAISQTLL